MSEPATSHEDRRLALTLAVQARRGQDNDGEILRRATHFLGWLRKEKAAPPAETAKPKGLLQEFTGEGVKKPKCVGMDMAEAPSKGCTPGTLEVELIAGPIQVDESPIGSAEVVAGDELGAKPRQLWHLLCRLVACGKAAPSLDELADRLAWSRSSVQNAKLALKKAEYIDYRAYGHRSPRETSAIAILKRPLGLTEVDPKDLASDAVLAA